MKNRFRLPPLLALLGVLVGCQTSPVVRTDAPGDTTVQGRVGTGLVVDGVFNADGTLDRSPALGESFRGTSLRLMDLRSVPSEAGFIRVQATIENTSRTRERFEFRYRWIDADGMEVATGSSGWQSETIEAREQRALTGVARSTEVVSFQLFVRKYEPRK